MSQGDRLQNHCKGAEIAMVLAVTQRVMRAYCCQMVKNWQIHWQYEQCVGTMPMNGLHVVSRCAF